MNFPLTFAGGVDSGSITVTEAQQAGLHTAAGRRAERRLHEPQHRTAASFRRQPGGSGFTVDVPSLEGVNCIVYNRAPIPEADITVTKNWVINGVPYANGAQPSNFAALLQLTGPGAAGATAQGWGVTRTGYLWETRRRCPRTSSLIDPTMCSNDGHRDECQRRPRNTPLGAGFDATLSQPSNTVTITNTVTCDSTLTL